MGFASVENCYQGLVQPPPPPPPPPPEPQGCVLPPPPCDYSQLEQQPVQQTTTAISGQVEQAAQAAQYVQQPVQVAQQPVQVVQLPAQVIQQPVVVQQPAAQAPTDQVVAQAQNTLNQANQLIGQLPNTSAQLGGPGAVVQQTPVQQAAAGACSCCAAPAQTPVQTDAEKKAAEFQKTYDSLDPAKKADADRFFAYLASHTPEENQKMVEFLKSLETMTPEQRANVDKYFKGLEAAKNPTQTPVQIGSGSPIALSNNFVFPTANKGTRLGNPHQGTHRLGNWQSDNAVDIGVPVGTPIYATTDGTISKTGGSDNNKGSRFNGYKLTLSGAGNAWWYGHLSKLLVTDGQQVKKGDLIGYSGTGNGVAHLHIGQQNGDPRDTFQLR